MGWVNSFFNDSYWSAPVGFWVTDHWESGNGPYELVLVELGSWTVGYRPTKIRFTFTGVSPLSVSVRGDGGATIYVSDAAYTSLTELTLNLTGDIDRLYAEGGEFSITNIEFYESVGEPNVFESLSEEVDLVGTNLLSPLISDSLNDIIDIIETNSHGYLYSKTLQDTLFIYGLCRLSWLVSLTDDLTVTENVQKILGISINELISIKDTQINSWTGSENIIDRLTLYDLVLGIHNYTKTISDVLDLSETSKNDLGILITDLLNFIESQHTLWYGSETLVDTITLTDILNNYQNYLKSINDEINFADITIYSLIISLLDHLGFSDISDLTRNLALFLSEELSITEVSNRGFSISIADVLAVIDVSSLLGNILNSIIENLNLEDTGLFSRLSSITATDSCTLTESIINSGQLYTTVYDTLYLNVSVDFDGDIWECYVLNTPKLYLSNYSGFNFNSFYTFNNRAFGVNESGIYELTGDTDNAQQIHTGTVFNATDFGSKNYKKFRKGYIGITGLSAIMVFETEDGLRNAYKIQPMGDLTLSSEFKSKQWKLSIADFDELSNIKLIPVILTR